MIRRSTEFGTSFQNPGIQLIGRIAALLLNYVGTLIEDNKEYKGQPSFKGTFSLQAALFKGKMLNPLKKVPCLKF